MEKNGLGYASTIKEQLTWRGILIGIIGAVIITTSSLYVALRMGALPWPTVFVAITSMAVLRGLKNSNLNEINVTHTIMSAGAMVAGGIAFTIPAIWILDSTTGIGMRTLLVITLCGVLAGIIFTGLVRKYFVEKEDIPYPIGLAAYETVIAGDEKGSRAKYLFSSLGIAGAFTFVRDAFMQVVPSLWMSSSLAAKGIPFGFWYSPMALGIGYVIGPVATGIWFLGGIIGFFGFLLLGVNSGWFPDLTAAENFRVSIGIGMMVGTGIGILVRSILPKAKEIYGPIFSRNSAKVGGKGFYWISLVLLLIAFALTIVLRMNFIGGVLTVIGTWLVTAMAAQITGQTGVNPMEIFGILVMLLVKAFLALGAVQAICIAGMVAVACGLTGDVLNDFKAGHLLKTNPKAQLIGESIGAVIGGIVACIALFALMSYFGGVGGDTGLPAPQAAAVAAMVGGLPDSAAFFIGLALGALLYILKVPAMTLGLGIYLPIYISATVFVGGLISLLVKRFVPAIDQSGKGVAVASGFLGGEGVVGTMIALWRVFTMS